MRTDPLPAQVKITATQGRGVNHIQVLVDDSQSSAAGFALLARVSQSTASLDREARLEEAHRD